MKEEENHDVFSDDTDETTATSEAEIGAEDAQQEAETQGEAQQGTEGSEQKGDGDAETPAADGDKGLPKSEKMIPESRLKAAIKDVNDKLVNAERELAAMKAAPRPDPARDPQGAALHDKIEMSKAIMMDTVADYDEKIAHFQGMAQAEPSLNAIIAGSKHPAKMAYDLATKDLEIKDLYKLKDDPDLKEFKAWKAQKAAAKTDTDDAAETGIDTATQLAGKKKTDAATAIPNLNRNATSVGRDTKKSDNDDDLFSDHYSREG